MLMTVKELKKKLAEMPDNAMVSIAVDDNDGEVIEKIAGGIYYEEDTNQVSIS
jgi:hypothetical protein